MNKCIVVSLLGVGLLSAYLDAKDSAQSKLLDAIEASDVGLVKKLLRRINTLAEKDKKELLEAAHDAIDEREQSVKLLKSPRDLATVAGGSFLTAAGAVLALRRTRLPAYKKSLSSPVNVCEGCFSLFALILGPYVMAKGVKCSTALGYVEAAEQIEELVEKSGAPSKESHSSTT